ncbi:MAG TPA: divalent cation tolerance protein CutA, partial [Candidatus Saccharimonadales bacterium]
MTCSSWQEAQRIADALLAEKLVACVEFIEVKSKYWWKHELESAKEVKLIMETVADKFGEIEAE